MDSFTLVLVVGLLLLVILTTSFYLGISRRISDRSFYAIAGVSIVLYLAFGGWLFVDGPDTHACDCTQLDQINVTARLPYENHAYRVDTEHGDLYTVRDYATYRNLTIGWHLVEVCCRANLNTPPTIVRVVQ
jgi:hypothetical protein